MRNSPNKPRARGAAASASEKKGDEKGRRMDSDGARSVLQEGPIASISDSGGNARVQCARAEAKDKEGGNSGVDNGAEKALDTDKVTTTSTSALQKQQQQQQQQHGNEENCNEDSHVLPLRPRRRGRMRAKRTRASALLAASAEEEETALGDVALLQEAQRYRNARVHMRAKNGFVEGAVSRRGDGDSGDRVKMKRDVENENEDDTEMGETLEMRFATERSGTVVEARMERYVQERMREKFGGDTGIAFGNEEFDTLNRGEKRKVTMEEEELYKVPAHLQVAPRPDYDPADGLPAAGVEEVALPEEVRLRNEMDTRVARERLGREQREGFRRDLKKDTQRFVMTGNLSANFVRHRRQWIENHVHRNDAQRKNVGKGALDADVNTPGERDGDNRNNAHMNALGAHTGKRTELATDAALFDRFRKRWRR